MIYTSKKIIIPSILIIVLSVVIIRHDGFIKILSTSLDSILVPIQNENLPDASIPEVSDQIAKIKLNSKDDESPEKFLNSLKSKVLNEIIPIIPEHLNISSIDCYNNVHLSPRLQSIITMDYFRFVKLNLKKHCTLWPDDTKCSERYCTDCALTSMY